MSMFELFLVVLALVALSVWGGPFPLTRGKSRPRRRLENSAATIAFFNAARAARRAAEREDFPPGFAGPVA